MILAPCLLVLAAAIWVITVRPEEVIVFFPPIRPYQPAQIAACAALIGTFFYMNSNEHADFDPS